MIYRFVITQKSHSELSVAFFVFTDLLRLPLIYFSAWRTNESSGSHLGDVSQQLTAHIYMFSLILMREMSL